MKVSCFHCAAIADEPGKIGFRAACVRCGSDLHVCKNCRFYSPGKPNDCAMPGTDFVRDREAANFCEEFSPAIFTPHPSASNDKAKRIFGEEPPKKKNPFHQEDHE